jgi:3-oxoadipate enol-lactonase
MGGYTAFRLHALAPERVAGMVLADTRAGADDEAGRAKRADQAARARREGVGWLAEAMVPALLGETTRRERPDVVAQVRALVAEAHAEGVARALEAMRARPDSLPRLGEIRVPVLVLVGEEDTLTPPAESRRIAEGVSDGRLVVLPGAGHLANLEAPDAFNAALGEFLGAAG